MSDRVIDGPSVSDEDAARLLDVEEACRRLHAPGEPGRIGEEVRGAFRHPAGTEHRRLWLTGDLAGAAWPARHDGGTGNARVMVRPGRRGEGLGTRLLGAVAADARSAGLRTVLDMLPAYRGRGLARQVKAASPRGLAFRRPDVHQVVTANETANAPMLAVNRALGFVPVATRTQARLDLAPDGS